MKADLADDLISANGEVNSNEIYRLLAETIEDYAIFALDLQGTILNWNLGGQRLKGYKAEEIVGSNFRRFYTQKDLDRKHPDFELQEALAKGKYEEEGWRVRKDGTMFWANVIITPLRDSKGRHFGFAKITRDLTERKQAEDSLREAYADLERRVELRTQELQEAKIRAEQAVRERDIFFSVASHELKTPLAALRLQTQIRKRNLKRGDYSDFDHSKLMDLCEEDDRQIKRLAFLVDNMFDVSKISSGNFELHIEEMDISALIQQCIRRLSVLLNQSGNVCVFSGPNSLKGSWDRLRLEQVMTNLLTNAGKYAPGKTIDVNLSCEKELVKIVVHDYGPGIATHDHEKVFCPFERIESKHGSGGLGLGLYIAKQIVVAHGGSIKIESESAAGAKFTIELPLKAELKG